MDAMNRLEDTVRAALDTATDPACPPTLSEALVYAVMPGGHRIRPRLCLAVAGACGDDYPNISAAAGASIELLHCASLVHDDMPCFDDADYRRGKPSVHRAFGEQIALLTGDALIVMAFEVLGRECADRPERLSPLIRIIGESVSVPRGIVAGQAWESEAEIALADYQREKTGALFAAATMSGAAAAGYDPEHWKILGMRIGEAYQVADDIRDVVATAEEIGKPVNQDRTHDRPNVVHEYGLEPAIDHLESLIKEAVESIPACPGREPLGAQILEESRLFLPEKLRLVA